MGASHVVEAIKPQARPRPERFWAAEEGWVTMSEGEGVEGRIATEIRRAYESGPTEPFAGRLGLSDVERAYRVQELNTRIWLREGRRIAGRKVGLTAKSVQVQLGVDEPDFGILFADMQVRDGAKVEHRLLQPRIEGEIVLVMGADITDPDIGPEAFAAAVARLHPALEIVDSRVAGWRITIVDTVADNASAGLFVLGESGVDPAGIDVTGCTMRMTADGRPVAEGKGAACMGSPYNSGLWLARKMIEVGRPLLAGDIVLSGALAPMRDVEPGVRYEARIDGIGSVSARF